MNFKAGVVSIVFVLSCGVVFAENGIPSGRGSVTGDPAASSANPRAEPRGTVGFNPSGSGTSTSGGQDDNGDQGRDKMPDSSIGVRPYDQQKRPSK